MAFCGVMARAALRSLVRSRTIECDVSVRDSGSDGSTTERRCTLGNRDRSAWLVERVWAEARDPALQKFRDEARKAGRGLWRGCRQGAQSIAGGQLSGDCLGD